MIWISLLGRVVGVMEKGEGFEISLQDDMAGGLGLMQIPYRGTVAPALRQVMIASGFICGDDFSGVMLASPELQDINWLSHSSHITARAAADGTHEADDEASNDTYEVTDEESAQIESEILALLEGTIEAPTEAAISEDFGLYRASHAYFGHLGRVSLYPDDDEYTMMTWLRQAKGEEDCQPEEFGPRLSLTEYQSSVGWNETLTQPG